jgi:hypothetical protein
MYAIEKCEEREHHGRCVAIVIDSDFQLIFMTAYAKNKGTYQQLVIKVLCDYFGISIEGDASDEDKHIKNPEP